MDESKASTSSSKYALKNKFKKVLNWMTWYGKQQQLTISSPQNLWDSVHCFLMFGREANTKHMILAESAAKYLGDNEGILNI